MISGLNALLRPVLLATLTLGALAAADATQGAGAGAPAPAASATTGAAPAVAPATGTAAPPAHAAPPVLPPGTVELHGTWNGQPFWARLLPPDAQFANHRVLQLSWSPPPPEAIAGTLLVDCPFILLDDQARVVAWNGRDGMSQVQPLGTDSYRVSRELSRGSGVDAQPVAVTRTIGGGRGWDLHLAPLLVALSWRAGSQAQVRLVDLFGSRAAESLSVHWDHDQVAIAGVPVVAIADADGRLKRLQSPGGAELFDVTARQSEAQP